MVEVITFGELLVDFVSTESGVSLIEAPAFEKAPGGAPANVAVALARLGVSAGFVGKVGNDDFGHFLVQTLRDNGVDTSAVLFETQARTALAFVSLKEDGERDFMFYRHPSADMLITADEIDPNYIKAAKVFHYGSISLISEPSRRATLAALEYAREAKLFISYDPNLRLALWPSPKAAHEGIRLGWGYADLIKVSEEEVEFLSEETNLERGAEKLCSWSPRLKLLVISRGAKGSYFLTGSSHGYVPGYTVSAVDTTGAGDGFMAGLLAELLRRGLKVKSDILFEILRFANAVGALTTTKRGAIPALPTRAEVLALMRNNTHTDPKSCTSLCCKDIPQ